MARKVIAACGGSVDGATIAILGLTFKPNTDDMRDAPSLDIIAALQDAGARVRAYDPEGMTQARELLHNVEFAESVYGCIEGADALVIVTEWDMFRALDLSRVRRLPRLPGGRRFAQHLPLARHGGAGLHLRQRGSGQRCPDQQSAEIVGGPRGLDAQGHQHEQRRAAVAVLDDRRRSRIGQFQQRRVAR